MTKALSFLLLFNLLISSLQSQIHKKYKEHGDKLMQKGDFPGAVKNYYLAMQIDSGDVSVLYAYAQGLRMTNNYKKAAFYYKSAQKLDSKREYILSMHYAGEMYKYLGNYKESLKEHRRFVKRYKGDKQKYEYRKSLNEVRNVRELNHLLRDTLELVLENNEPVNTPYSEFAAFFEDENHMMYSTLRSDSLKNRLVLDSATYFSRIYLAENQSGWQNKGPHPVFHDDEEKHIANAVLSSKKEYVYYTECEGRSCLIIRAKYNDGNWSEFEPLPKEINLPGTNNTQPFQARINGYDILFFSSDRPNGYGKLDIWYTIAYSNGLYEKPVNLGDSINSPGNEICPFYMDEENALYFSSDWFAGLGGFDIFRSVREKDEYYSPENLGIPFNSSYNDLYFRYYRNHAVLTSNRIGSLTDQFENCCNDLFFFDYKPRTIIPEAELSSLNKIEKLLPLRLYFHNDEPNPRTNDTSTSILYSATYVQYISRLPVYEREYSKGLKGEKKLEAEEEIDYFFENEVKLGYSDLKEALRLLEKELENGKKLELIIRGFASPLSRADYNKRLTLRRISAVENEIRQFNRGSLEKYLNNGLLTISRFPFGEDKASRNVSDDLNDKRNAIYSKRASFERRVEIIAVKSVL